MRKREALIFCLLLVSLLACNNENDWRFTLDETSTEPYGLYLSRERLSDLFRDAEIITIDALNEDVLSVDKPNFSNTLLISITNSIFLDSIDVASLKKYVTNGGQVLIVSNLFSDELRKQFQIRDTSIAMNFPLEAVDSISYHRIFFNGSWYTYSLDIPFETDYFITSSTSLGTRKVGDSWRCNLMEKRIGQGNIIFGNSPEMLTNYALLKDSNIGYYEKFFSNFNLSFTKIKWLSTNTVRPKVSQPTGQYTQLFSMPPYRYAFFVLLLLALLFIIFETKRRQRSIRIIPPVTNDSMGFVETVGKLYYCEQDHTNLAQKMVRHYLEHIYSTYNIPVAKFDVKHVAEIAQKLKKNADDIETFIQYIHQSTQTKHHTASSIKKLYHTLKKYS